MSRPRVLLIDTNILLLLIVGRIDRGLVARFKRTADRFDSTDYDLMVRYLSHQMGLATTPHVLTEAGNLLAQLKGEYQLHARQAFAKLSAGMQENWQRAADLVKDDAFARLGLTDAAILSSAKSEAWQVLTDDYMLAARLMAVGVSVVNFNHLRDVD